MLHDIGLCCGKAREKLWWSSTFVTRWAALSWGGVGGPLVDERDEADSFKWRKHCEKEMMTCLTIKCFPGPGLNVQTVLSLPENFHFYNQFRVQQKIRKMLPAPFFTEPTYSFRATMHDSHRWHSNPHRLFNSSTATVYASTIHSF